MKYEDIVVHCITDSADQREPDVIDFSILQSKIEDKIGSKLSNIQIEDAKKILASLNSVESETCTALPTGWVAK